MYTIALYTSIYNCIQLYIYTLDRIFRPYIYIYIYMYINYIIKIYIYIYIIHLCSSLYLYNQISPKQTGGFQNKHAFSLSLYLSTRMRAFAKKYEDLGRYKHGDFSRSSGYITTREDPIRPYIYINTSGGTKFMLLESLIKHPSRSTAEHISKSISCGRCGTVDCHPLLNLQD